MKESFWGYWIIVLGIFVIIIMMLVSNVTTTSTQDYYLLKDVTEAAMVDAVDYSYYRQYQELKINREKFVENFLRRFAENVSLNTYTIDFYDLYEAPPKVSVKVTTKSGTFSVMGDSTSFDIVNKVDAILENSGTAGSSGRENNSNISIDDDVVTGEGDSDYEGTPSINRPSSGTSQKQSLYDYVLGRINIPSTGYYDCYGTRCEKTNLGHLKRFACNDYSEYNSAYSYDRCANEFDAVYNRLPEYVRK